jgi:hypothetical protein
MRLVHASGQHFGTWQIGWLVIGHTNLPAFRPSPGQRRRSHNDTRAACNLHPASLSRPISLAPTEGIQVDNRIGSQ